MAHGRKRHKPKLSLDLGEDAAAPAVGGLPQPGLVAAAATGSEKKVPAPQKNMWHKANTLAQAQLVLEERSLALLNAAAETEPSITALLTEITGRRELSGARMHGLDFKFKGLTSLTRKVLDKWRQEIVARMKENENRSSTSQVLSHTQSDTVRANALDREHHAITEMFGQGLRSHQIVDLLAQQNDCLRYTMVFPDDVYVQGVNATLDALEKSTSPRIKRLKLKNFWRPNDADREYLGLHATFECLVDHEEEGENHSNPAGAGAILDCSASSAAASASRSGSDRDNLSGKWTNGTRFEVQWHTEDTIHTKEEQCHLIYEKFRVDMDVDHKAQYWEEMVGLWSTINMPAGVEKIGKHVTSKFDAFASLSEDAPNNPQTPRPLSTRKTFWSSELERTAVMRKQRAALLKDPQITAACEKAHRAAREAEPVLQDLLTYICGIVSVRPHLVKGAGDVTGVAKLNGEATRRVMTSMTLRRKVVAALLTGRHGKSHINIFSDRDMIEREANAVQRDMLDFSIVFTDNDTQSQQEQQVADDSANLKLSLKQLYSRVFDILDINISGALSEKELYGFCAAMMQKMTTGSTESTELSEEARSAKACVATLVGASKAATKINSSPGSMTRRQFMEIEPCHSIRVKVEPYYADIQAFCQKLLTMPELTVEYVEAGQKLSTEEVQSALEFLQTEDWGFSDDQIDARDCVASDVNVASGSGSSNDSYYSKAVRHFLGWLVRNGCAIDRLDNHWECGVGSSGGPHTEQQPLHWNALHASIHVPPSVVGMPKGSPEIWMRLHLHTPLSYDVQEGWLREVRSLMGTVISTTTFDDHAALETKARALRVGRAEDGNKIADISTRMPAGCENIGVAAHLDPPPPRHEMQRRLKQSVVIDKTSPHDHVGRVAVHGCDNCGFDLTKHWGLYRPTGARSTDAMALSRPEPAPKLELESTPRVREHVKAIEAREDDSALKARAQRPEPEPEPEHQPSPSPTLSPPTELVVQPAPGAHDTKDLEEQLAAAKADVVRMGAELGALRDRHAEEAEAAEAQFKLALQAAATAVQNAEQKCKAAELKQQQAEKQATHLAMAQETTAAVSDVKQQRFMAAIRALRQLNEEQQMQILDLTRNPPGSSSGSIAAGERKTACGDLVDMFATPSPPREPREAWSLAHDTSNSHSARSPAETASEMRPEAASASAPLATAGAAEPRKRDGDWELDLAWKALDERRAALQKLLDSGPETPLRK